MIFGKLLSKNNPTTLKNNRHSSKVLSYKDVFSMPKAVKITGRSSAITNSFVNGIIPIVEPTEEEIKEALEILDMDIDSISCIYCGSPHTEWDHFRPLIIDKKATGFISEIHNLVPCCGKCNQSKGNQHWRTWMYSDAPLSPKTRGIDDIDYRAERLEKFEQWGSPIRLDIEAIVGKEKWNQHWKNCEEIQRLMKDSQTLSDDIRNLIQRSISRTQTSSNQDISLNKTIFKSSATNIQKEAAFNKFSISIDSSKPIGKIVQEEFSNLLRSEKISEYLIESLQRSDYSKQMFNVNYPVLIKINYPNELKKGVDRNGINRYYVTPLKIRGEYYLLTSQWYNPSKDKLIHWMRKYI